MADRWLRWYDGTVRDGKLRIAAEISVLPVCSVLGVWASLLEDAATSSPRGFATRDAEHHALYLQISEQEIGTVWNALERVGTIKRTGDGIKILNWDKRQFETDQKDPTAKDRKLKWKQRHAENGTVGNGAERLGTPETETETEKTIVQIENLNGSPLKRQSRKKQEIDPSFIEFYSAYPRRQSKQDAIKAYAQVRKAGVSHETIMGGLARAKDRDRRFREAQFTPLPASWLRAGGFEDDTAPQQEDWKRAAYV